MWCTWDEWARAPEGLQPRWRCTVSIRRLGAERAVADPGCAACGSPARCTARGALRADPHADGSRGQQRSGAGAAREAPHGRQAGGPQARAVGRRVHGMVDRGHAPAQRPSGPRRDDRRGVAWGANLRRAELDKEWERRGPRGGREAEDRHIFVTSARAGPRVLARRLKLTVNAANRAEVRPGQRTFLGVTCPGRRPHRRRGREQAREAWKHEGRPLTSRTRGGARGRVVGELQRYRDRGYASWWRDGSAVELQGAGRLEPPSAARRAVEAVGSASIPRTAPAGGEPGAGLAHGHIRPWAVAFEPPSSPGDRAPRPLLRQARGAAPPSRRPSLPASTEPPDP